MTIVVLDKVVHCIFDLVSDVLRCRESRQEARVRRAPSTDISDWRGIQARLSAAVSILQEYGLLLPSLQVNHSHLDPLNFAAHARSTLHLSLQLAHPPRTRALHYSSGWCNQYRPTGPPHFPPFKAGYLHRISPFQRVHRLQQLVRLRSLRSAVGAHMTSYRHRGAMSSLSCSRG